MSPTLSYESLKRWSMWDLRWRGVVFFLASTSILALLVEFYRPANMRAFTLYVFLPAIAILAALAVIDYVRGDRMLLRAVVIGSIAGLVAACAYDIFRLPFVFSRQLGLEAIIPPLPLFKVFPEFGRLILQIDHGWVFFPGPNTLESEGLLGMPPYQLQEHLIGWVYHFSNGMTFGVMYIALLGRNVLYRSWLWGVPFATGLELIMLLTPYPQTFSIKVTPTFIAVTLAAHIVFGATMGWSTKKLWSRANYRSV